ncbi:Bgt-797 [Blumeria graminis f. sp. tritici]|uniref:L-serine ammonia-lyase n=2 Tax=Blumeria graminis f. sp. tritici TaxID=62690 RepID=A0A061HSJ3_BLUGR|nr:Catabolic L-serine deaminase [Blumeria graminis f. sp. tritici 96224]VCU40023.1 Bgt-797 [Blumeria graminis f. sp. tritici]
MGSIETPIPSTSPQNPWVTTPLTHSEALSTAAGCNIYLKLESHQPSNSFKSRGIGNLLVSSVRSPNTTSTPHFYCASGGNAGLACATAATSLSLSTTIVVPQTTKPLMIAKIRALGDRVRVLQFGKNLGDADKYLRSELLAHDPHGVYVSPYDHPAVWAGNATLIDELATQIPHYDSIVCSVGGGGLLVGLIEGLDTYGILPDTTIVAVETRGAESLNVSLRKGELLRLPAIESIATSLGVSQVAAQAFELAKANDVKSVVISDAEAACACAVLWQAENVLVEPACGASIAVCLNGDLRASYSHLTDREFSCLDIVIVVCGGSNVTTAMLGEWIDVYGGENEVRDWFVGKQWVGGSYPKICADGPLDSII